MEIAEGFVYRHRVESSFVEEIRRNKRRIEEKTAHAGESDINVKEGIGGVRDPEFTVQLLQLMAGGTHPELRTGNTLDALQRLTAAGLVTPDEARSLEEGYIFARTVEHRLQLMDERPERCIPRAPAELDKFGRRLGYRDGTEFLAEYRARTAETNAVFQRLFYGETNVEAPDSDAKIGQWLLAAGDPENADRLRKALAEMGFADPQEAETLLLRHVTGNQYGDISPESRENFGRIAGRIAGAAAATEDPLAALRGLESLALSVPSRAALYRSLSESPLLIERFSTLAAGSPPLWQIVIQRPELVDLLADDESLESAASPPVLRKTDAESTARALLRGRLAIGAMDLWRLSPTYEAPARISRFADWAAGIAIAEAGKELGFDGAFAIIGMGKLGGEELGYASDLDVMYVSDPDHVAAATRLAERVSKWLQNDLNRYGFKFEVDARLRPDGRKGNLVLDLETYRKYYETSAATWERQALIKARAVAGDAALGKAFAAMARDIVYGRPWTDEQTEEVRAMKRRIETERLHDSRDLKLGPGGMADIEWIVQLSQLIHGGKRPKLRQTGTLRALRELRDDARITQDDWEVLDETYTQLTQLRNHLFLKRGVAADIPERMPEPLADSMTRVRVIFLRRFYGR
jgi:glutamate-ammonia-ligase adenylyltransferase